MVSGISATPDDTGSANPDNDFRFDSGSYIFNLSTKGLASGTYGFTFTVTGDSSTYTVINGFAVK
jgi:hypothetical protein